MRIIKGKIVQTLFPAADQPGESIFKWDGKNYSGAVTPCGIYFYRLKLSGDEFRGKILKIK
ncbi:hypothetical protein JXI42_00955 [bacterium]|nr:hypothetical protein [bacterium]